MADRVRVGVVGTGFGKQHIMAFSALPRSVVTSVCSTDAGRAAEVARQFGVPHSFGDYRAMLDEAPIDAVAVITQPAAHASICSAALNAGKHVLCQKPLAATLAEARAVRDQGRTSGQVHAMDQNQRYLWHSLLLKKLIDGGAIGRPMSLTSAFGVNISAYYANPNASPNKNTWYSSRERGGGMLFANGGHVFDRLLWLFGPVRSVMGRVNTALTEINLPNGSTYTPDSDDSYNAVLEFESGLMASTQCTPVAFSTAMQARLEIHGTDGSILEEGLGVGATVKRTTAVDREYTVVSTLENVKMHEAPEGVPEGIYALGDRFVRAILDGEPMSPTFEDGFRAQEVIEAILQSDQTGQRRDLPLA
ncbi:MAG TPA: Gfo/Idh/MocA family oxidoreductase [Chloroflexota bacterium]|nr:Gfo/Idh/MocA family oxidoreductase [Chloroflexota bacterium]